MELNVVQEKENPFFKRKDLILVAKHANEATPSKEVVKKLLAEKYNVAPEQVEICYIFTLTGVAESKIKARILKEVPKEVKTQERVKNEAQNIAGGESAKQ